MGRDLVPLRPPLGELCSVVGCDGWTAEAGDLGTDADPGHADLIAVREDRRGPLRTGDDQHGHAAYATGEQTGNREHIGTAALLQRGEQVEHLGLIDQWVRPTGSES